MGVSIPDLARKITAAFELALHRVAGWGDRDMLVRLMIDASSGPIRTPGAWLKWLVSPNG